MGRRRILAAVVAAAALGLAAWLVLRGDGEPQTPGPRVAETGARAGGAPAGGESAGTPPPSVPESEWPRIVVRVENVGGRPIGGATVYADRGRPPADGDPPPSIRTGEDGVASLPIPSDATGVVVRRTGYLPATQRLAAAERTEGGEVSVALADGRAIAGLVRRFDGTPVGGLPVRVRGLRSGGRWNEAPDLAWPADLLPDVAETVTAADGSFRIGGLREGLYATIAAGPGIAPIHDGRGTLFVKAGTEDVRITVADVFCGHVALQGEEGGPLPIEAVRVEFAPPASPEASGERWSTAWMFEHLAERVPPTPPGHVVMWFQSTGAAPANREASIRASGFGYEAVQAAVPLVPASLDSLPPATTVTVRKPKGPRGTLLVRLPAGFRPEELDPLRLLFRPSGTAGEFGWIGRDLQFRSANSAELDLPAGRYELGGTWLFEPKAPAPVVEIAEGGRTEFVLPALRRTFGTLTFEAWLGARIPLSDYNWRVVEMEKWEAGRDQQIRQGFASGAGPEQTARDLAAGRYMLVVTKPGWPSAEQEFEIHAGQTTTLRIALREP